MKTGGVVFYTDIHGHSNQTDCFMYSCDPEKINLAKHVKDDKTTIDMAVREIGALIKSVPDALDRFVPVFKAKTCKFETEKNKLETARVVLCQEMAILNSHTLECTFHGSEYL